MPDNKFFDFVETYKDEIIEFFKALKGWIEAIVAKLSTPDDGTDTEG
ncbi:MAG: hypothetical protein ACI4GC_08250 [Acutalibacteraceae bacterium]